MDAAEIKAQLIEDTLMLRKLNIMDYSLLLGIEKRKDPMGAPTTPRT